MQQSQKAAAKAEPECVAGLGGKLEAGVVNRQLVEGVAQLFEVLTVRRIEPAEDHPFRFFVAGQDFRRVVADDADRVADMHMAQRFDVADEVAHLACGQLVGRFAKRREVPQFDHVVRGALLQELDLLAFFDGAIHHANVGDRAAKLIVVRVEDHRLQCRLRIAFGRRYAIDDCGQHFFATNAGLGTATEHFVSLDGQGLLHFFAHLVGSRVHQVDLVHHRDDGEIVFHCRISVRDRLSFDSLKRIDQQHSAFAASERARDLVLEVNVPRRVDQVELVLATLIVVVHRDGARFDRDAALPLEFHVIEQLLLHFALADGAGTLHQPIG